MFSEEIKSNNTTTRIEAYVRETYKLMTSQIENQNKIIEELRKEIEALHCYLKIKETI